MKCWQVASKRNVCAVNQWAKTGRRSKGGWQQEMEARCMRASLSRCMNEWASKRVSCHWGGVLHATHTHTQKHRACLPACLFGSLNYAHALCARHVASTTRSQRGNLQLLQQHQLHLLLLLLPLQLLLLLLLHAPIPSGSNTCACPARRVFWRNLQQVRAKMLKRRQRQQRRQQQQQQQRHQQQQLRQRRRRRQHSKLGDLWCASAASTCCSSTCKWNGIDRSKMLLWHDLTRPPPPFPIPPPHCLFSTAATPSQLRHLASFLIKMWSAVM